MITVGAAAVDGVPVPGVLTDPWAYIAAGAIGVILLALRQIATGKWYHHTTVERELAAANEAVERAEHDRDEWRAESRIKDTVIADQGEQLRHAAEVGELMKAMVTEVRALAHRNGEVTT